MTLQEAHEQGLFDDEEPVRRGWWPQVAEFLTDFLQATAIGVMVGAMLLMALLVALLVLAACYSVYNNWAHPPVITRIMTRDDIECFPPNTVAIKAGTYFDLDVSKVAEWCGFSTVSGSVAPNGIIPPHKWTLLYPKDSLECGLSKHPEIDGPWKCSVIRGPDAEPRSPLEKCVDQHIKTGDNSPCLVQREMDYTPLPGETCWNHNGEATLTCTFYIDQMREMVR